MSTASSCDVDNVFEDTGDLHVNYYPVARNTSTLGSGGSSNGGLEVFIEREEEDEIINPCVDPDIEATQTVAGSNAYRSTSLSPPKIPNGHSSSLDIVEEASDICKCVCVCPLYL
jgi:hypothetical protein